MPESEFKGHSIQEFEQYAVPLDEVESKEIDPSVFPKETSKVDLNSLKIDKKYKDLIKAGWDEKNDGEYPSNSELVMAVASHFRKREYNFETFYNVCLDVNYRMSRLLIAKHGGDLDGWLWRTWSKLDQDKEEDQASSARTEGSMELTEAKEIINGWLTLTDDRIIDVILGTIVSNWFPGDPVWMLIIGPPSTGKTETLTGTKNITGIYLLSAVTAQTFISGKLRERSLLFNLDKKIVVLKEFGTILSLRNEVQAEILSQLREIYDGRLRKGFGEGKTPDVEWTGKMGLIAGATPIIDKYSSVHRQLGERFLQYRMKNESPEDMAKRALQFVGQEEKMRREISTAMTKVMARVGDRSAQDILMDQEIEKKLIALSLFCAMGRTPVSRDRIDKTVEFLPQPEGPARLIKQMRMLASGIAVVQGKAKVDDGVYEIVRKVGRDVLTARRDRLIYDLHCLKITADSGAWITTREVAENTDIPTPTAKIELEDLAMIGLVNRRTEEDKTYETAPYEWQLRKETSALIETSEIFKQELYTQSTTMGISDAST